MRVTDAEHFDERGREARRVEGLEKEDSRTENDSNLRVYTCIPHVILFAERVFVLFLPWVFACISSERDVFM
jgi:hypothetical protein